MSSGNKVKNNKNVQSIIVSYEAISNAMGSRESAMSVAEEAAHSASEQSIPGEPVMTPVESAAMLSAFGEGLTKLEEEEKDRGPHVLTSIDHMAASLLQSHFAEKAREKGKLELGTTGLREAKFDDEDYFGWVKSFFTWWRGIKKHPWLSPPPEPETLPDNINAAVLGDWGTGMYGAPISADTITKERKHSLILHLGDVYYSGTEDEVEDRFLDFWPRVDGALNRALNSNHEMYTGGHAYFKKTLKRFGQRSSCFALQNSNWLLVGLDTAYANPHKGGLTDDQTDWLRRIINKAGQRKVILFSHHQPFSWLDLVGKDISDSLSPFLSQGRIFAWYWGHEHRCVIYDRHEKWGLHGRCAGHSGYPYFRDALGSAPVESKIRDIGWRKLKKNMNSPGCVILDGPNEYMPENETPHNYGTQGHMTLEFQGNKLTEIVHHPNGDILLEAELK